jgi:hypothetical protein
MEMMYRYSRISQEIGKRFGSLDYSGEPGEK